MQQPIGVCALVRQRNRRQLHQPSVAQGIRRQQLAAQRHPQPLLGRQQQHAHVVEHRHRLDAAALPGQDEPAVPPLGLTQQRLMHQSRRVATGQTPRHLGGRHHDQRRVDQAGSRQPLPRAFALPQSRVITLAWQVNHLERGVQVDHDARMLLTPTRHARQQPVLRKRRQGREAQALLRATGRQRRRTHALVDLRQRRLHRAQQRRPGCVEHHAAATPVKQGEPELLLQYPHLLTDGAVCQMQLLGRRAQIGQLGNSTERGQSLKRDTTHAGKYI